jgi:hypothetical protein
MTDPTTLLALAERCEQATGPDKELDFTIDGFMLKHGPETDRIRNPRYVLPYTASLDAAVTLVPEGCDWHCQSNPSVNACWASVSPMKFDSKLQEWGSGMRRASTTALALCAAALRARAAAYE